MIKFGIVVLLTIILLTASIFGISISAHDGVDVGFVVCGNPTVLTVESAITNAITDSTLVTVSSGARIVTTKASFTCDNDNTVPVGVRVGFGTASTPTTSGVILTHPGVAAGSGVIEGNGCGIIGIGADGEDVRISADTATGGSCRALLNYFTF